MKIEVTQCSMCKHYSEEQYCEIWQQYIANDAFYCACGAKADRKTENSSEKPNNCEECKHWNDIEDGCADRHGCRATTEDLQDWKDQMWTEAIVTEPTTEDCSTVPTSSKMEQVETMSCAECKHRPIGAEICEEPCHYEPQTDWHYDEQDATWYPYKHEDEPRTEMTTEQIVNELLSIKKILDDGKMPKQRCGNCKHLTYRWNKTWCDIKCDNPHDMVCDKWERSE